MRVVDYGIRGMHLAYDLLDGYDALVIVDAVPRGGDPGEISVLEVGPDDLGAEATSTRTAWTRSRSSPRSSSLGGTLPPTYVVGCRPATTRATASVSATPVAAAVPLAVEAVDRLLDRRPLRVTVDAGEA